MTTEQAWWAAAAGALAIAGVLVALVTAVRAHRRASRAEQRLDRLAEHIASLGSPSEPAPSAPGTVDDPDVSTFVITRMHSADEGLATSTPVARDIDGRLFADIVARETVVKAASWTHGLRRALSAESRNRIRFEVRRETRRTARDRRAETKQALREYRARERSAAASRTEITEDVA